MIGHFLANRSGASSIEYATLAAMVSITIVIGATAIGARLNAKFLGPILSGFQ